MDFYWISCNVAENASGRFCILATHFDWTCWMLTMFVVFFVCVRSFPLNLTTFLYLSLKHTPDNGKLFLLHKTLRDSVSFFLYFLVLRTVRDLKYKKGQCFSLEPLKISPLSFICNHLPVVYLGILPNILVCVMQKVT